MRAAAAIALFDLYRRLRKPSVAPLSAGLAIFTFAALAELYLGRTEYSGPMLVLQSVATVLIVAGVLAHFMRITTRAIITAAIAVGLCALVGSVVLAGHETAVDAILLVSIMALAGVVVWKRDDFRRAAGNSYEWGLVICGVDAVMYAVRFFSTGSPFEIATDQFLHITVSVAIGLYLINLEFNTSYLALTRSENRYHALFETAGDSILVTDFSGRIVDANTVATQMLGYSHDELCGMRLNDIDDEQSAAMVAERSATIYRDGRAVFESTQKHRNGTLIPVEVSANRIDWEDGYAVLGIVRDLTERKETERAILQMAYYDPLTGLANRTLFNDRLALAVAHTHRSGENLALLFIDIDHFKVVNDTLGHPTGDRLLAAIGERLRGLVREGDTVARLGGDEYTLLLPETSTQDAAAIVAWKVLDALQAPFTLDREHEIHVTASIGIALTVEGDEIPEELVRNADIAMFRAKECGRNTYQFFDPAMNATAVLRFDLKNDLRRALERGELELYFQPQVRLSDMRIRGAEALLRWHHPERGELPPAMFVPLAEESGMIAPIGWWVLDQACRAARSWRAAGHGPVRVAVNLSTRQFLEDDLVGYISELLDEYQLPPHLFELEITESMAMQHSRSVIESFRRLGALGIRMALDNFGTGSSSLDRLKALPIHTLKVGQPFVDEIGAESDSAAIATTIVVLGRSLGLNVIAEGVETPQQREFLNSLGCDEMQGFLFSPAVTAPRFLEMLAEQG